MSLKQTEHQKEQQAQGEKAMQYDAQQNQHSELQQQQSSPSVEKIKATWKQQVGAAKVMWGKLTDDELLKSEGHADKLTGLVQERYALSQEAANNQVKQFIEKCKLA
jgi:uncharacterized protein YjbJ (UPF0337 family)